MASGINKKFLITKTEQGPLFTLMQIFFLWYETNLETISKSCAPAPGVFAVLQKVLGALAHDHAIVGFGLLHTPGYATRCGGAFVRRKSWALR
jgi:hypothetical protein